MSNNLHPDVPSSEKASSRQGTEKIVEDLIKHRLNDYTIPVTEPSHEEFESDLYAIMSPMVASIEARQDIHPALECLGRLYKEARNTAITTASIVYRNHWGDEPDDKAYVGGLFKKSDEALLFIIREQISLLPLEDACAHEVAPPEIPPISCRREEVCEDGNGGFTAAPRETNSNYEQYGKHFTDKIKAMLEDIHTQLQRPPTYGDIEYISKACGLRAYTVRDWFITRNKNAEGLDARKLLDSAAV